MPWRLLLAPMLVLIATSSGHAAAGFSGLKVHDARFVAVAAEPAPGADGLPSGAFFSAIENASIGPQGGVALVAERNARGNSEHAIWTDVNGRLTLIVTEDFLDLDGEKIRFTNTSRSKRLPNDRATFRGHSAIYSAGAQGIELVESVGGNIAVHPSGQIAYVQNRSRLFAGEAVPGRTRQVTGFGELIPIRPIVNSVGSVVFLSREEIDGLEGTRPVLWQGNADGITPIGFPGEIAPGTGGDTFVGHDRHMSQNDNNEVLFAATLASRNRALFKGSPNSLEPLVLEGDIAPGTDGAGFSFFANPVINNAGNGAFFGGVDGGNKVGLWSFHDGEIHGLAIEGESADHIFPGSTFRSGEMLPFVNNQGHVVFQVAFGGVGVDNESAILVYSTSGDLLQVLKSGDVLVNEEGKFLEMKEFYLFTENGRGDGGNPLPSNGIDGRVTSLSDSGKLLFYNLDSNRIDAAVIVNLPSLAIPEPTFLVLFLTALAPLHARRRRFV